MSASLTSRLAIIQSAPVLFDAEASHARLVERLRAAADGGADLVVFPEAYVGGYPKGVNFGAPVGLRTDEGRDLYARYAAGAIEVPGPGTQLLSKAIAEAGVNAVVGVIEQGGATLYCTVLYFDRAGTLLGKHRKLMPTAAERLIWGFGDGSTLAPVDLDVGRVGAVICWENYMPLLRTHMYRQGVQIYCAPTVDDREVWASTLRHIAVEGRCFVVGACQYARRADYPDDWDTSFGDDPNTALIRGGSCVVDPFGEFVVAPAYAEDTVLFADVDLSQIRRGKYDLDVTGHYLRPEVFRLEVDETERL
ncbi:MAG: carbon-nitrogen hydrolase family protein [Planctomycetota bacterium]|nr:carbon-nitrogen hydrolase family protein [Planctomycetota bacterium]